MIVLMLAGRGIQSSLETAGLHAGRIAGLWNVFLWITAVVYVIVMIALLVAVFRRGENAKETRSQKANTIVAGATAVSTVILFGLLVASVGTGRDLSGTPRDAIRIVLTGHQWWWQVEYPDGDVSKQILDANEINIPVGRPVLMELRSSDVIHSFWVPALQGKQDLIPGRRNAIVIQADKPGVYRGQCAEFCGLQHAKMAFWVNALEPDAYRKWADAARKPAKLPSNAEQRKGQDVFMSSPCPLCHTIRGTNANGNTAPDLTHFGSHRSIAAGTLPNRRGDLGGWIVDPQHIKPGSQMPPMILNKGELEPLLAYLESLQ